MKPNPVKKTVEYCCIVGGSECDWFCRSGHNNLCYRYDKKVGISSKRTCERPSWCTDETFVRVKIEPYVKNGSEYCWVCNSGRCSEYDLIERRCHLTKKHMDSNAWVERPEACRKLEVE